MRRPKLLIRALLMVVVLGVTSTSTTTASYQVTDQGTAKVTTKDYWPTTEDEVPEEESDQ